MTRPPPIPRRPSGFTLIELIVVLLIVGIMAVAVIPRMVRQAGIRVKEILSPLCAVPPASTFTCAADQRNTR